METLILVEIMHLKCQCDLENKVKVIKNLSTLFLLPTMYLCKFGQNPFTGSEDNALKQSYTETGTNANEIHTKTNMSSLD